MANFRVKLICMNWGGLSPGAEHVEYLSEDRNAADTFILYHINTGKYEISHEPDRIDTDDIEVLAKISRSKASIISFS